MEAELIGRAQQHYYVQGRGRRLLAYSICSSPNQVPLHRSVMNEQKARGTSWAMIKESTVLSNSSDEKAGHARTPILSLSIPIVPVLRGFAPCPLRAVTLTCLLSESS
ncbi:hypothetical protein PoB_001939700 [Plakobranchus ocellatus]|uniref:Uncharacterized protein n=1 Tax=Plakobranchus ocellatus TaxID=259542 RepID=A0AAV3ZEL0_9GAST|nr:hypothetical protein PoB_001939700 [Plakobranchus ocellatus]